MYSVKSTGFLHFHFISSRAHRIKSLFYSRFERNCASIMNSFSTFGLYKNLENLLHELNNPKHKDVGPIQELVTIFNNLKENFEKQDNVKKYPLIILEGLDGSGKTAMTRRLASKLNGEKWETPPESTKHLRPFFDHHLTLRSAYYSLGNYIAALEVSMILTQKPVVMDRFWHSTTAYGMSQMVADNPDKFKLPTLEDTIYEWPVDLLKPDIVLLLTVSEQVRRERHSRRSAELVTSQEKLLNSDSKFRQDIMQAYTNMRNPGVVLVNGDGSIPQTLSSLWEKVKPLMSN